MLYPRWIHNMNEICNESTLVISLAPTEYPCLSDKLFNYKGNIVFYNLDQWRRHSFMKGGGIKKRKM